MSADRGVAPFLVPGAETVATGEWLLHEGDGIRTLPDYLPFWDYQTDLEIERTVEVDVAAVRAQAALPGSALLALVVEWSASASQTAGLACRETVVAGRPMTLSARLRGTDLNGRLCLTTRLILAADLADANPFVASHAGDVLYETRDYVQLQGDSGRLPISVIDFASNGLDPKARWWLDVHSDPTALYAGAVRLYLNKADVEIVRAAERAANPTPLQKRLLEWLHTDIAQQLVERCLRRDWLDMRSEYSDDPDSLGAAITSLVSILFNETPEAVASLRETDPGRFAVRLHGALRRSPHMEP